MEEADCGSQGALVFCASRGGYSKLERTFRPSRDQIDGFRLAPKDNRVRNRTHLGNDVRWMLGRCGFATTACTRIGDMLAALSVCGNLLAPPGFEKRNDTLETFVMRKGPSVRVANAFA